MAAAGWTVAADGDATPGTAGLEAGAVAFWYTGAAGAAGEAAGEAAGAAGAATELVFTGAATELVTTRGYVK